MTNYDRGTGLERDVAQRLIEAGCVIALRSAGSHGVFDVIALREAGKPPLLVQCKADRHRVTPGEWLGLVVFARRVGGMAVLADRSGPRRMPALWTVTGERPRNGRIDDFLEPLAWGDVA